MKIIEDQLYKITYYGHREFIEAKNKEEVASYVASQQICNGYPVGNVSEVNLDGTTPKVPIKTLKEYKNAIKSYEKGHKFLYKENDTIRIYLREVPYDIEDENSINWTSTGGERCFEIIANTTYQYNIGLLLISENTATSNDLPCKTYINWLEFSIAYKGKHLLRPVMNAIYERFGEFHFESIEGYREKYCHVGATSLGIDEITELEMFKFSKKD